MYYSHIVLTVLGQLFNECVLGQLLNRILIGVTTNRKPLIVRHWPLDSSLPEKCKVSIILNSKVLKQLSEKKTIYVANYALNAKYFTQFFHLHRQNTI